MSEKKTPEAAPPPSKSKRFFKLAGMTMAVAGNYAKTRVKTAFQNADVAARELAENHRATGERIARTLGELKGAVMKVGQMASIVNDILPKELTQALTTLQQEAPPMPFSVIAEQIEREFGAAPEQLFSSFDSTPFAAASIGQVHRARTDDGREVVVKVQYPGVDESCDSDLAHLKLAFRASGLARIGKKDLDAVFQEIQTRLHEELDYCNEADNVRLFHDFYKDNPHIVIPEVVGERSAKHVLTLTYEPGDPIAKVKEPAYDQETRNKLGQQLFDFVCSQFFSLGVVHGDPNPGNFAFRTDGSLVVYDFGCTKVIKPEIAEVYGRTIDAAMCERYEEVEANLKLLGARTPDGPDVGADFYRVWRQVIFEPLLTKGPFDYGSSTIHHEVLKRAPLMLKNIRSFQPPVELLFFNRSIAGHYGNLRKIGTQADFFAQLQKHVALPHLHEYQS